MRRYPILLLSAWTLFAVKAQAQEPITTPSEKGFSFGLRSREIAEHRDIYDLAVKQRLERVTALISTVKQSKDDSSIAKFYAIQQLGAERASEAVNVLTADLLYEPKGIIRVVGLQPEWAFFPAAVALIEIGQPAIEPVIQKSILGSGVPRERRIAARVLEQIEGKEQAIYRLQRLAKTQVGLREARLSEAAVYIKNVKF